MHLANSNQISYQCLLLAKLILVYKIAISQKSQIIDHPSDWQIDIV